MADRFLVHPFRRGAQGGLAVTDDAELHLRDKVEAVLFTAPGERVNQPRFGAGLDRTVFEPTSPHLLAALEFRISQALRHDLGDEVLLDGVDLEEDEGGTVVLTISYRRREDRRPRNLEVRL